MIPKCPCKDCTKRTAECHALCNDYKEWSDSRKSELEGLWKANEFHAMMIEKRLAAKERYRRNHKWK